MVTESTAIAVRGTTAPDVIAPKTFTEMIDLADRLSKSSLLPEALRNKPADVLMQIMAGQELGLHAIVSMSSFDVINGKPVINAKTAVALVLASGKCEYFRRVSADDKSATYATKRRGEPEQRCTWTMDMAKTAALHQKDNWRTYPRAQLSARAKSELANDVYPDVLKGIAIKEEIADRTDRYPRAEVVDAEFTESTPVDVPDSDPPEVASIDTAETLEALKAQAAIVSKLSLTAGQKQDVNARYAARLKWLKAQPAPVVTEPATTEPAA